MPKILENDLIRCGSLRETDNRNFFIAKKITKEFATKYNRKQLIEALYYDCTDEEDIREHIFNEMSFYFVYNLIKDIIAIYRKVDKDYICIWERNQVCTPIR